MSRRVASESQPAVNLSVFLTRIFIQLLSSSDKLLRPVIALLRSSTIHSYLYLALCMTSCHYRLFKLYVAAVELGTVKPDEGLIWYRPYLPRN